MDITSYTLLMSLLWSSVLIVLLRFFIMHNKRLRTIGLLPLGVLTAMIIMRIFVIFEMPFVTIINDKQFLPHLFRFLATPLFELPVPTMTVHVHDITNLIWIAVSTLLFVHYVRQWRLLYRNLASLPESDNAETLAMMAKIAHRSGYQKPVTVLQSSRIPVPMMAGFYKPRVCLPEMLLSEVDKHYILLHEWSHFQHRDNWWKLLIQMIHVVFWWNPFVFTFQRDANHLLELRCDERVTQTMEEAEKREYLSSILKVVKWSAQQKEASGSGRHILHPLETATLFERKNGSNKLQQRFQMVLEQNDKKRMGRIASASVCFLIFFSTLLSFAFVVQPSVDPPVADESGNNILTIEPENAWILLRESGEYVLIVDRGTVGTIEEELLAVEPFSKLTIIEEQGATPKITGVDNLTETSDSAK